MDERDPGRSALKAAVGVKAEEPRRIPAMRSLHQDAVDRLAGWIVAGRFDVHDPLPNETEIGAELGVSRTVVREAMRTLAAKGIVSVRRRHGTRIEPLDRWHLFDPQVIAWRLESGVTREFVNDLIDFRLGIEPYAAELAARNPDFPAAALDEAFKQMTAAAVHGEGDYHAADLVFHETILNGSRNQFLRHLVPIVANALKLSFHLSVVDMESARRALPLHRAVADAIIGHDGEGARRALTQLIESARQDIYVALSTRHLENIVHARIDRPDVPAA
ncbi:DNA-binding FadR family transcriptional regulator [Chelatococcus caeni]|uniref:DNA-binding FadR family transcriptional regulator n=1 Tax=Chelatococcus caeni TaxID=1348468 RepID=A0A840BYE1_9HYPH|nr:FadR/GntR family transcriptional regulator [Chelatococcus caeni]MBB4018551.1 DNA-binding FadR family transcriptional regulator [Chelatococcus caeni]